MGGGLHRPPYPGLHGAIIRQSTMSKYMQLTVNVNPYYQKILRILIQIWLVV